MYFWNDRRLDRPKAEEIILLTSRLSATVVFTGDYLRSGFLISKLLVAINRFLLLSRISFAFTGA